jgi:hypothetical protein
MARRPIRNTLAAVALSVAISTVVPAAGRTVLRAPLLPTANGKVIKARGAAIYRVYEHVEMIRFVVRADVPDGTLFWVTVTSKSNPHEPLGLGWLLFAFRKGQLHVDAPVSDPYAIVVQDVNGNKMLSGLLR